MNIEVVDNNGGQHNFDNVDKIVREGTSLVIYSSVNEIACFSSFAWWKIRPDGHL
jgi:hypothetical protein